MFTYLAEVPTSAVFMVRPAPSAAIAMEGGRWFTDPSVPVHDYADIYGNECARTVLPVGRSRFGFSAVAVVPNAEEDADPDAPEVPPGALPDETLLYTLPSRYCLPDLLANEAWQRSGALAPGYQRVQAICDHVHQHVTFQYGSTTAASTAADVNATRLGVCRDFAHLAISFCPALNTPPATRSVTCRTWTSPRTRHRWTSPRGWKCGWVTAGGRSTPATTPAARAGS